MSKNITIRKKTSASKKKRIKKPKKTLLANWDTEQCFQDQDQIFKGLFEDFSKAQNNIDIEMFIFQLDELGKEVIRNLKQAADRGVQIRLIVDGIGSPGFTEDLVKKLKKAGINVKVYKPISQFLIKLTTAISHLKWQDLLNEVFSMNSRNHRKLCLIDKTIGWVGSANVCSNHATWRETMIRVTGSQVEKINDGFEWIWKRASESILKRKAKDLGNSIVCHSLAPTKNAHSFRIQLINSATKNIRLVNPYFIPPYSLLIPLLHARQRGVEVELLTSQKSDYIFTRWFTQSYYNVLLKQGVKIYEQKEKFVHSKILIVDDLAIIGTSNYNHRSFNSDLEIDLLVSHIETIKCLILKWNEDLANSEQVTRLSTTLIWKKFIQILNPLKKLS